MLFEEQEYQEECVNNIIKVLSHTNGLDDLSKLESGIKSLHNEKNIPEKDIKNEPRLDILMETGTGKTFTYIKTMYEMNKQYEKNKFVIFVPRLAIRAGIIQNIDLTSNFFFSKYNKRLKKYTYEGDRGTVLEFIRNEDELSVLILTGASINSRNKGNGSNRVLTDRANDWFPGRSLLEKINDLKPVVFIDEPHLLKGAKFIEAYNDHFPDILLIRFGATYPDEDHSKLSNVVYVLDGIKAFNESLVKKISVSTISDGENDIKFYSYKNKTLQITYSKGGIPYKRKIKLKQTLSSVTGNSKHNFHVASVKAGEVFLSDGSRRNLSSSDYRLTDDTIRSMIKSTIEIHFEKEEVLFKKGIKTLSLFFIPNVDDFRGESPRIKNIFVEEYKKQRNKKIQELKKEKRSEYLQYLEKDDTDERKFCDGYFSGDSGTKEDKENYGVNLILKDKTKLLSTEEPLRFIFSVWALQEGWDNPNVFNICKLAPTDRETKKKQQVGRGLRLAVDNEGKRQTVKHCGEREFEEINELDVIVSESESDFIEGLQKEIIGDTITSKKLNREDLVSLGLSESQTNRLMVRLEDGGIITENENQEGAWDINSPVDEFLEENKEALSSVLKDKYDDVVKAFKEAKTSPIKNRNERGAFVSVRQKKFKEFESLWHDITKKAKIVYGDINEDALIEDIKQAFDDETIDPVERKIIKKTYNHKDNTISEVQVSTLGKDIDFFGDGSYEEFVAEFADKENLPLKFCYKMFNALDEGKIKNNPVRACGFLSDIVKESIHKSIIKTIGYNFDGDVEIKPRKTRDVFYNKDGTLKDEIPARELGRYVDKDYTPEDHYLYDNAVYDSGIELEVIKGDSPKKDDDRIVVFAKLPKLSIPTPYKNYNPDFAYFIQRGSGKKLFLIVETKGYNREGDIPEDEQQKIAYAEKFFTALEKKTDTAKIIYKKRINKQSLWELLRDIGKD